MLIDGFVPCPKSVERSLEKRAAFWGVMPTYVPKGTNAATESESKASTWMASVVEIQELRNQHVQPSVVSYNRREC